jgi:hypothetical protein
MIAQVAPPIDRYLCDDGFRSAIYHPLVHEVRAIFQRGFWGAQRPRRALTNMKQQHLGHTGVRRMLIALCTVASLVVLSSEARANACSNAVNRANAASTNFNRQIFDKFRQLFGREMSDARMPQECKQAIAFWRWKISAARSLASVEAARNSACQGVAMSIQSGVSFGAAQRTNSSAQQLVASSEAGLATTMAGCQQVATITRSEARNLSLTGPVKVCGGQAEIRQAVFQKNTNRGFIKVVLHDRSTVNQTIGGGELGSLGSDSDWTAAVTNRISAQCDQMLQSAAKRPGRPDSVAPPKGKPVRGTGIGVRG